MEELPPIEKIPEAYTAIIDKRVEIFDNYAIVKSSTLEKEYLIKWNNNLYYSNDNSTYWQNYIGYPVIAVLMLQGKLSLNESILEYFKGINWNELNKKNKSDYHASLEVVLESLPLNIRRSIDSEIDKVYEEIKSIQIELTKKKNIN